MQSIVGNFPWQRPPWQGGTTKYRLGMRPISLEHWFQGQPSPDLRVHKYNLLKRAYGQVVQALPEARDAQARLTEQMQALTRLFGAHTARLQRVDEHADRCHGGA